MRTMEKQLSTYVPSIPHLSNGDVQGLQIYRIHELDKSYVFHSYEELVKFKQRLTEEQYAILTFIGVHTSVRFNHLLYLFKNKYSRKKINDALQGLLYYRLIEKWRVKSFDMEIFEETYTLSDNGYKLLKYWKGNMFFFSPERLDNHGKYVHLRYWHDIDLLCHLRYAPSFIGHIMHPSISKEVFTPPLSFAAQDGVNQEFNFVVYSTLLTDKKDRLRQIIARWRDFVESGKDVIMNDLGNNPTILVIYVSTEKQAKQINNELLLDLIPGKVLLCIGETLHVEGLQHAFYQPLAEGKIKQLNTKLFTIN
ncbi:hypothetical protein COD05_14120 [Bacillus cereus]|uniref:hypothetical protein n=1 Tax=unclassified Bacillus (in: firmicutes) TaxID=185979 RepID=UPI000BF409A4|nr:hypothetical protein [Bacillus wiedmannii]PFM85536.1 hypothetical protein COJ53_25535 [Bacillus cereus]RFB12349.1 hypothetical protein DZB88_16535 [Bacillus sp. OE]RFB68216.1 hypothetical protein DZB94_29105 [Bacillus sp. AW]PFQ86363.1 hypothetical protein COK28_24315 [Bacillus cereus]